MVSHNDDDDDGDEAGDEQHSRLCFEALLQQLSLQLRLGSVGVERMEEMTGQRYWAVRLRRER